jgi:hypothetical protein
MSLPPELQSALARTLPWGKHRGKTLQQVLNVDPGYIRWLATQDINGPQGPEIKTDVAIIVANVSGILSGPRVHRQQPRQNANPFAPTPAIAPAKIMYQCKVCQRLLTDKEEQFNTQQSAFGMLDPANAMCRFHHPKSKYYNKNPDDFVPKVVSPDDPVIDEGEVISENQVLYRQDVTVPDLQFEHVNALIALLNNWTIPSHQPRLNITGASTKNRKVRVEVACVIKKDSTEVFIKRFKDLMKSIQEGRIDDMPIDPVVIPYDETEEAPF